MCVCVGGGGGHWESARGPAGSTAPWPFLVLLLYLVDTLSAHCLCLSFTL